jgi:hypothetical protein
MEDVSPCRSLLCNCIPLEEEKKRAERKETS